MRLTIELDREVDGRWIAEVPELNVLLYGASKQDAIERAESAAREIVLDRIAHGELPPDSADAVFDSDGAAPARYGSAGFLMSFTVTRSEAPSEICTAWPSAS